MYMEPDKQQLRKERCQDLLDKYPTKYHWRKIHWTNEYHTEFGPQGQIYIIRKSGQRGHPDCTQDTTEPAERDRKKLHFWGSIGYDHKSELYFYDIPTNINSKITIKKYVEILDEMVLPWLENGEDFVLEKDGDSGHRYNKNSTDNIVIK